MLNIGHLEQYGSQMEMEQIGGSVLAQEQQGSLKQVNFLLLHALKLLALCIFYHQWGKTKIFQVGYSLCLQSE